MPHPVVMMGKAVVLLERVLRRLFRKTSAGELVAGIVLAAVLVPGVFLLTGGILALCEQVSPALRFGVETLWCWQTIAIKGLRDESTKVYRALKNDTLTAARSAVARIVGR
ncbi:MAG: cobalamin biosynthesis protein, partial [Pygmaiobacter sp.]